MSEQIKKFKRGDQIAYLPMHAEGDINHPDVEYGFVTSGPNAYGDYFCHYWKKGKPGDLRTKANSECTPVKQLVSAEILSQSIVQAVLEEYC